MSSPARLPPYRRTARPRSGIYVAASRSSYVDDDTDNRISIEIGIGIGFPDESVSRAEGSPRRHLCRNFTLNSAAAAAQEPIKRTETEDDAQDALEWGMRL